jgi:hypothetical protein
VHGREDDWKAHRGSPEQLPALDREAVGIRLRPRHGKVAFRKTIVCHQRYHDVAAAHIETEAATSILL